MNTQRPRTVAPLDIALIVCLLAGSVAFWPFLQSHGPSTVVVFRDDRCVEQVYPLATDKTFSIRGKEGPMTLSIRDNSVRVTESSCPLGICVQTGAIRSRGQQIVCAPNHVLVELETSAKSGIDGVTQ